MTDSSPTYSNALLEVPNPFTSLSVGRYRSGAHFVGISVNTTKHVRFYAHGGVDASDVIGQATGQVWLQSMQKAVAVAKNNLLFASPNATMIAGKKGVTILAGYAPGPIDSEDSAGSFPASVKAYASHAETITQNWTAFSAAMGGTVVLIETALGIASSNFGWKGVESVVGNLAGVAVNTVGLTREIDVDVPGINIFSEAGILWGSMKGTIQFGSVPGLLIASPLVTQFSLAVNTVRGLARAALNAVGPVDVLSFFWLTTRSYTKTTLAARTGPLKVRGSTMAMGTPVGFAKTPRLPTTSISMNALHSITMSGFFRTKVNAQLGSFSSLAALDTSFEAVTAASFKVGLWQVDIKPTKAELGNPIGPTISITSQGVDLKGPGWVAKTELGNGKVNFRNGAGSLKIAPGKSIAIDGTTLKIQ